MSLRSMWQRQFAAIQIDNLVPLRPEMEGAMPHWSTCRKRKMERGLLSAEPIDHVVRPYLNELSKTLCGWPTVAFRVLATGIKPHFVVPVLKQPITEVLAWAPSVSCQHCWNVLNDFATWRELHIAKPHGRLHMLWTNYACCDLSPNTVGTLAAPAAFMNSNITTPRCVVCLSFYEELYGKNRRELRYRSYETWEQANNGRR